IENAPLFADLETWALAKESVSQWGECVVFIEVILPQGKSFKGYHNQVDMLICFSQRIALCEVKSASSFYSLEPRFDDAYIQIDQQAAWLKELLREGSDTVG